MSTPSPVADTQTDTAPETAPESVGHPTPDYPERRPVQLSDEQIAEAERWERVMLALDGPQTPEPEPEPSSEDADADPEVEAQPEPEAQLPAEPTPEPEPEVAPPSPEPSQLTEALERVAAMEAALRERETSITERAARIERFERFAEKAEGEDFLGALEEMGWSFDDISRAAVTGQGLKAKKPQPDPELTSLREEMKRELEAIRAERQRTEDERARASISAAIRPEIAPGLAALGDQGVTAVLNHVKSAYTNSGKTLSTEAAVAEAENVIATFLSQFASNETVLSKYLAAPAAPAPTSEKKAPRDQRPALSNRAASSVSKRGTETLTEEDRIERALRHLI